MHYKLARRESVTNQLNAAPLCNDMGLSRDNNVHLHPPSTHVYTSPISLFVLFGAAITTPASPQLMAFFNSLLKPI